MNEPIELTPELRTEVRKLRAAVESTDPRALPPLVGLTPPQADGLACVWCAADYTAADTAHVPVGVSSTGSQVFACQGACRGYVWLWRIFEREFGNIFTEFRDYDALLREMRAEQQANQSSSD